MNAELCEPCKLAFTTNGQHGKNLAAYGNDEGQPHESFRDLKFCGVNRICVVCKLAWERLEDRNWLKFENDGKDIRVHCQVTSFRIFRFKVPLARKFPAWCEISVTLDPYDEEVERKTQSQIDKYTVEDELRGGNPSSVTTSGSMTLAFVKYRLTGCLEKHDSCRNAKDSLVRRFPLYFRRESSLSHSVGSNNISTHQYVAVVTDTPDRDIK